MRWYNSQAAVSGKTNVLHFRSSSSAVSRENLFRLHSVTTFLKFNSKVEEENFHRSFHFFLCYEATQ